MTFLYPSMLWALTALAIPIVVHLFNFRRHKLVYFSNTATLKNIQQESARTKKLKHLVLLALRCLFIIGLVLAFAFPYRSDDAAKINTEEGVVGVYVDNSMSMKALSTKTTLIEDARELAKDLVNGFPPSTRYLLLTNSFEVENEYPMSQQEMLDQLDRMKTDGPPIRFNEVLDRFSMLCKYHGFEKSTLIAYSDFQENMLDLSGFTPDSSMLVVSVPMRATSLANLSIDTLWLELPVAQPYMANGLHALVTNHGDREVKGLPVNLSMDGKVVASTTVDVEGGATAELLLQIVPERVGDIPCALALNDYPVTFDDTYRFVIGVKPKIKVVELNVDREPSPVATLFDDDPQYEYRWMAPNGCDFEAISKAHMIVVSQTSALNSTLRQTLINEAMEGASVVFFHDDVMVDTNAVAVSDIALQHEFFSDMIIDLPRHADLPQVRRHIRLMPTANTTTLMHLANGDPLLTEQTIGKGRVYDFATTLDGQWSSLADNSIFVPLMLKMALIGGGVGRLSYTIGEDQSIPFFQYEITEAGFYTMSMVDSLELLQAWNDSRLESDMRSADNESIKRKFKDAGIEVIAVLDAGVFDGHDIVQALARKSSLWRWFVLLALVAVFGEIAVLRFWK